MAERTVTTELLLRLVQFLNPLVTALLKSRLHALVSKDIMLIHFQGRKSGRWFATPVSYVQDGNRLRVVTEYLWWKNLRERPEARVTLRGAQRAVRATTHGDGGQYVHDALRDFLTRIPRDARYFPVRLDRDRKPNEEDIGAATPRTILIELELTD